MLRFHSQFLKFEEKAKNRGMIGQITSITLKSPSILGNNLTGVASNSSGKVGGVLTTIVKL